MAYFLSKHFPKSDVRAIFRKKYGDAPFLALYHWNADGDHLVEHSHLGKCPTCGSVRERCSNLVFSLTCQFSISREFLPGRVVQSYGAPLHSSWESLYSQERLYSVLFFNVLYILAFSHMDHLSSLPDISHGIASNGLKSFVSAGFAWQWMIKTRLHVWW